MFVTGRAEMARFLIGGFLFGAAAALAFLLCGCDRRGTGKKPKGHALPLFVLRFSFDLVFFAAVAFLDVIFVRKYNRGHPHPAVLAAEALGFCIGCVLLTRPVAAARRALRAVFRRLVIAPLSSLFGRVSGRVRASVSRRRAKRYDGRVPTLLDAEAEKASERLLLLLGIGQTCEAPNEARNKTKKKSEKQR